MDKGKLFLIPTVIGDNTHEKVLAPSIAKTIKNLNVFITENVRTARRVIRKIDKNKDINNITFYSYGKHDSLNLEKDFLQHILSGTSIGLMSEAGLPCIADPGSKIVEYAHNFQINVIPLVGPSSITLALMASGLNGQSFAFRGYLPIDKLERKKQIRELEILVKKTNQTQIFMETPYRNNQLMDALLKICNNDTKLCVASDITLESENIKTKTIGEWRHTKNNTHKKPTIYILG